jgi:hypothetical protein
VGTNKSVRVPVGQEDVVIVVSVRSGKELIQDKYPLLTVNIVIMKNENCRVLIGTPKGLYKIIMLISINYSYKNNTDMEEDVCPSSLHPRNIQSISFVPIPDVKR